MENRRAEILVAGAGPAGATIARLLAAKGRHVVLVDPGHLRMSRLELLAPPALGVIEALGLAQILDDNSISTSCLGIRRAWGPSAPDVEDFLCHPRGQGFVVDRAGFDARLRLAAERAGAQILQGRVVAVRQTSNCLLVTVEDEGRYDAIAAPLVVDATGRPAALARRLGARRTQQHRLVAELLKRDVHRETSPYAKWLHVAAANDC